MPMSDNMEKDVLEALGLAKTEDHADVPQKAATDFVKLNWDAVASVTISKDGIDIKRKSEGADPYPSPKAKTPEMPAPKDAPKMEEAKNEASHLEEKIKALEAKLESLNASFAAMKPKEEEKKPEPAKAPAPAPEAPKKEEEVASTEQMKCQTPPPEEKKEKKEELPKMEEKAESIAPQTSPGTQDFTNSMTLRDLGKVWARTRKQEA